MKQQRETLEQTAQLLFGLVSGRDWLSKARRERDRLLGSKVSQEQTDHALNFAMTTSHLEDWIYHLHIRGNLEQWNNHQTSEKFDEWVRSQSLAMRLLADVNNAAKHRVLNKRGSNANAANYASVAYRIDHPPIFEDFVERISRFSEIVSIEEIRSEDELVAYEMRTKAHIFSMEQGFRLFIDIANEAIRFWEDFLDKQDLESST